MNNVRRVRTAIFLLLAATFPALAQEPSPPPAPEPAPAPTTEAAAPPATAEAPAPAAEPVAAPAAAVAIEPTATVTTTAETPKTGKPWRGTQLTYGHAAAARSLNKSAEPMYNPEWVQRLELRPEWHFGSQLYLRGRFEVGQELTMSDSTNTLYEMELADPSLDIGVVGFEDPFAKIRLAGSARLTAPLSKNSQAETRRGTLGAGVSVSRRFNVLSGINVAYAARYNQRFHRYTTRQNQGPLIEASCFDPNSIDCFVGSQDPYRNAWGDLTHGPSLSFSPHSRVSLSAQFQIARSYLYRVPPSELDALVSYQPYDDRNFRDVWGATFAVGVDVLPELNLGLSSSTFSAQRAADQQIRNPLANRFTTLSLDVSLDVEALTSRFF